MNFKLAILFAFVAMIAGFFIRPAILPCKVIPAPTAPVVISHGPVKPDTVTIERYIPKKVPVYLTRIDTFKIVDSIFVERKIPIHKSYEFFTDKYYVSQVYAWAECPVDSFYNQVRIDYERYFYDVYSKKINSEINKSRWSYILKGSLIGFCVGTSAVLLTKH